MKLIESLPFVFLSSATVIIGVLITRLVSLRMGAIGIAELVYVKYWSLFLSGMFSSLVPPAWVLRATQIVSLRKRGRLCSLVLAILVCVAFVFFYFSPHVSVPMAHCFVMLSFLLLQIGILYLRGLGLYLMGAIIPAVVAINAFGFLFFSHSEGVNSVARAYLVQPAIGLLLIFVCSLLNRSAQVVTGCTANSKFWGMGGYLLISVLNTRLIYYAWILALERFWGLDEFSSFMSAFIIIDSMVHILSAPIQLKAFYRFYSEPPLARENFRILCIYSCLSGGLAVVLGAVLLPSVLPSIFGASLKDGIHRVLIPLLWMVPGMLYRTLVNGYLFAQGRGRQSVVIEVSSSIILLAGVVILGKWGVGIYPLMAWLLFNLYFQNLLLWMKTREEMSQLFSWGIKRSVKRVALAFS